jgi:hypothetical protein
LRMFMKPAFIVSIHPGEPSSWLILFVFR